MANAGKFYPFNRYINDIALLMDGSHKIIPSKYILLKTLKNEEQDTPIDDSGTTHDHNATVLSISSPVQTPTADVTPILKWNWPDDIVNYVNSIFDSNNAQSLEEINYQSSRYQILDFMLNQASEPNNSDNNEKYYIGGDINFISHDVYDGMLYSEIYLHVSNDAGRYRMRVNNTNQAQNKKVLTDLEPYNSEDTTYSFQGVLLFYNIYKTGSDEPFACDIPLGIFVLFDENGSINSQELIIQSDELLGNGTAWSTRICSRFVSSAAIDDDMSIKTGQSDYSTLTSLLSEFGKAIKIMEKNISSREEDILTVKSYLDDFKHYQTVNVPYVLGDWWYINGRPVRPIDELELVLAQGNQFSWTSTEDMRGDEDINIIEYINGISGLKKFLLLCASQHKNGRFEGVDGMVALNYTEKTLTVECKSSQQNTKIFRTFDVSFMTGNDNISLNVENNKIEISCNG